MTFENAQHIHIIGAGGIGLSALAKLWISQGKTVSGSDTTPSDVTRSLENLGMDFREGHALAHVTEDIDLVVYSPAVPEENVERQRAKEFKIPQLSYPEALGELSRHYSTIVVTGTNGKSTTTAMLGLILEAAGYDPTVILGSLVPTFELGNIRVGKGRFLIVEGCEYKAHMLNLQPEMVVLTNIEEDHLDYYRDIDHIIETFQAFVDKLKGQGLLIWNANDSQSKKLNITRGLSYGMDTSAEYVGTDRRAEAGSQTVSVTRHTPAEEPLGELSLHVPGEYNLMNALAATAAAMELGVPFETCQRVLRDFSGIWRRFERVGVWHGAEIISDYGHHPTAVKSTIDAAREFFPDRRIVLVFQPHQHSRTEKMFDEFVEAVHGADEIILPEIYRVEGRTENEEISSRHIVEEVKKRYPEVEIRYVKDLDEAESMLRDRVKKKDVVLMEGAKASDDCEHELKDVLLVQGAGDIDALARKLTE